MKEIGEDPDIKLVDDTMSEGARNVDMYSRRVTKDLFQEESRQEAELKKDLQRNSEKMNQLNEDNRLNVLNREVSERITEIKKQSERHAFL
jgi:phosphoribosylaminoimidazole-succinocarboxamide synthase